MPLYEFHCNDCQDEFEELVRSSSAIAEVKCPECGSQRVRRKVSIFASKVSGRSVAASAASCAPSGV